jgi:hypothetical protein
VSDNPRPRTIEYVLKWPIEFGQETITVLTIRRLKGKDLRALRESGAEITNSLETIARLTAQPRAVIDEMDSEDFTEVGKIIEGFTKSGQATGEEPTPS